MLPTPSAAASLASSSSPPPHTTAAAAAPAAAAAVRHGGDMSTVHRIPRRTFAVIEFPGYLGEAQPTALPASVLAGFGGMAPIEAVFAGTAPTLAFRYRPEDRFAHPVEGDPVRTNNVLVKVVTRRRKRDGKIVRRTVEVLGGVTRVCRFRRLGDYQHQVSPHFPMHEIIHAMRHGDQDAVERFTLLKDYERRHAGQAADVLAQYADESHDPSSRDVTFLGQYDRYDVGIPFTPSFSSLPVPSQYSYNLGFSSVKVAVPKEGQDQPELQLITRYITSKPPFIGIDFRALDAADSVPQGPNEAILSRLDEVTPSVQTFLQQAFAAQAILLRNTTKRQLPQDTWTTLTIGLASVAYLCTQGPWRDCWIRYGYDPRTDDASRQYQTTDIRNAIIGPRLHAMRDEAHLLIIRRIRAAKERYAHDPAALAAQIRAASTHRAVDMPLSDNRQPPTNDEFWTYLSLDPWDGVHWNPASRYLRHHLVDPELQSHLAEGEAEFAAAKASGTLVCHPEHGWYPGDHLDVLQKMMKRRVVEFLAEMSPAAASQSDAQDLAMLPHHRRPLMSRTTSMSRKLPDLLRDEQAYRSDNYTFRLERLMQRLDDADDEHVDDGEAGVEGEGDADDDDGLAEGSAARGSGAQDASDLDPLYGDEYTRLTSGARRPLAALVDDDEEEEEEEEDNIDHAAYA